MLGGLKLLIRLLIIRENSTPWLLTAGFTSGKFRMPRCYMTPVHDELIMVHEPLRSCDHFEVLRLDTSNKGLKWERATRIGELNVLLRPDLRHSALVSDAIGGRGNHIYILCAASRASSLSRRYSTFLYRRGVH